MSSWNSPLWKTKSPPVSPGGRRRKFDKLESSPNNRASCVRCGEKIVKDSERVGIQAKFSTPNGQQVWRMRYYHGGCVDDKVKRKLHLEPNEKASKRAKVSTTTDKAKKQKPKENKAVPAAKSNPAHKLRPQQRNQLAKELRLLRKYFAIAQGVARNEEYKIFPNRSIDEIIQKLPSNSSELMQCWGIKEKRLAQYGSAILLVVQPYLSQNNNHQQRQQQQNHNQQQQQQQLQTPTSLDEVMNLSVKALKILATKFGIDTNVREKAEVQNDLWEAIHPTIETDSGAHKVHNSDSDDEEVEITRQLTVEEIVAQRVREAEARGEVFEIL